MKVRCLDVAREEIRDAADNCAAISPGLGAAFKRELRQRVGACGRAPTPCARVLARTPQTEEIAREPRWRRESIRAYLERDIPALGFRLASATLRRFWNMLAHYSGQLWNGAELARAFGVSEPTVRRYLDILAATCMVRILPPWHENVGKRQVKAPKIYLADCGLLHALLDIDDDRESLLGHPHVGASWEGFALHQIVRAMAADWRDCYHWRLHTGAELDLLVTRGGRRIGFEIKRTDAPRVTPSMRSALDVLRLEKLYVVHAGAETWPLDKRITALPLARLFELLRGKREQA